MLAGSVTNMFAAAVASVVARTWALELLVAMDPPGLAVPEHDVFAARPLGERGDSRLGGQFVDVVVRRADPLTAKVNRRTGLLDRIGPTPDAVARLQNDRRAPLLGKSPGGRQAGITATDDDCIENLVHAATQPTPVPDPHWDGGPG
jgi:hypothetical protein